MAEVQKLASVRMPPCFLAAGSPGGFPFLAAGPAAGHANSSSAGGHRRLYLFPTNLATGLLRPAGAKTFRAPADFCSLDWANPTEATCWRSGFGAGLIAGGLENGAVAIWDPRTKLDDLDLGSDSAVIDNYFTLKPSVPCHGVTTNLAAVSSDSGTSSRNDAARLPAHGLEFEAKWYPSRAELKVNENHFLPEDLQDQPPHHKDPVDVAPADYSDMLALLCSHSSPVHGLSFSSQHPNFLSSGSSEGKIVVWDISEQSLEAIPTLQFSDTDNAEISHLSWSPLVSKVIASASNFGAALWDVSLKSPLIRKISWMTECSHVEWSPRDENLMAVAAGNLYDLPAVKVWDLRKMEYPVFQFCEKTRGVLGLSWSPFDSDILVGCTNNETVVALNVKKGEVVDEMRVGGKCCDICWSKSRDHHFAVSYSEKIDFYYRAPGI